LTVAISPPPELVFTDPDGFRLQYHDVGAGPVLVMLHGGGPGASAWSNFKQNVEPLARHYRLLLVDQPGFGGSDKPEHDLPQHELTARKLIGLLDHLGLAKVTPVGNSIGGAAALELALTAPDRVEALVLMAPAGGSLPILAQPSPEARLLFDFYNGPGATPDRMRQLLTGMVYDTRRIDEDTLAERLKAASDPAAAQYSRRLFGAWGRLGPTHWRRVHEIRHRTLLLWGREDRIIPLEGALHMLHQMRNARLTVLPKCGHWCQFEAARQFEEQIIGFLDSGEMT
jgi:pimeloyl-ACP methyl ester carboxylesterase